MHKQLSTKLGETKLVLHIEQTSVDVEVDNVFNVSWRKKMFSGACYNRLG